MNFVANRAVSGATTMMRLSGGLTYIHDDTHAFSTTYANFGGYIQLTEISAPGAGAANTARIYAIVGGDTLTDLAAVFQDGTVAIFAQESTPLNAPIFTYPSDTEVKTFLKKEHPGLVKIISVFPNGEEFVLKQIEYHDPEKIAVNMGAENPLPEDWLIETTKQRTARLETERLAILPEEEK